MAFSFANPVGSSAQAINEAKLTVLFDATNGLVRVDPDKTTFALGEIAKLTVELHPRVLSTTTPRPNGLHFSGWSADASGTANPIQVVMDRDKVVSPIVEPAPEMQFRSFTGDWYAPAIAADGTIYLASSGALYSLTPDLKTNWVIQRPSIAGNPAIGDSGNIYVAAPNGNALCVSPNGQVLWEFSSGDWPRFHERDWSGRIALTADETFYFTSGMYPPERADTNFYVYVVKDGALLRKLPDLRAGPMREQVPVVGPDDTLYFPTESGFAAHKPFGVIQWTAPYPRPSAIDANGRLYSVTGSNIVALDFNGQKLWETALTSSPTEVLIGEDGTVFAGSGRTLIALDTNGVALWTNTTPGRSVPLADGGAIILKDETIRTTDAYGRPFYHLGMGFHHILPDGTSATFSSYAGLGWANYAGPPLVGQPIITEAGDVYARSSNGALYHYKGADAVARSSWLSPLGYRNTGRAVFPETTGTLKIVKRGSGWALRKSGNVANAIVETSANLEDWETLEMTNPEISIQTDNAGRRYYRLRLD